MNWAQYKDPVSHMCLADTVGASWSLTQEIVSKKVLPPLVAMQTLMLLTLANIIAKLS